MLLTAVLGWLEREQRDVIAFLRENRALNPSPAANPVELPPPSTTQAVVFTPPSHVHRSIDVR